MLAFDDESSVNQPHNVMVSVAGYSKLKYGRRELDLVGKSQLESRVFIVKKLEKLNLLVKATCDNPLPCLVIGNFHNRLLKRLDIGCARQRSFSQL